MEKKQVGILVSHLTSRRLELITVIYDMIKDNPNSVVKLIEPENFTDEGYFSSFENKEIFEVLIVPPRGDDAAKILFKHFKNIKWVQGIGAGLERLLAVDQINVGDNIVLTNLKSAASEALSEFAMLGALYFTKDVLRFQRLAQNAEWDHSRSLDIGYMTRKKALVVGLGSIGCEIARKCVFGYCMEVVGVKRNPVDVPDDIKSIVKSVETPEKIGELVQDTDYIFLALPFSSEGHVISRDIVQQMKKGVILVNVGRGSTIEEKALIEGLKTGIIKGAALDVFEQEPLLKDSPFYSDPELREKVLNTSHRMDRTQLNETKSIQIINDNIERYLKGLQLTNVIDKKKGY